MHTPGPWKVTERRNTRGQVLPPAITAPRNGHDGVQLAIVSAIRFEEGDANALLIAAAPDMLEALKRIASTLGLNGDGIFRGALADQIRIAIAKAEGR
jgi:hypothetical protein